MTLLRKLIGRDARERAILLALAAFPWLYLPAGAPWQLLAAASGVLAAAAMFGSWLAAGI